MVLEDKPEGKREPLRRVQSGGKRYRITGNKEASWSEYGHLFSQSTFGGKTGTVRRGAIRRARWIEEVPTAVQRGFER